MATKSKFSGSLFEYLSKDNTDRVLEASLRQPPKVGDKLYCLWDGRLGVNGYLVDRYVKVVKVAKDEEYSSGLSVRVSCLVEENGHTRRVRETFDASYFYIPNAKAKRKSTRRTTKKSTRRTTKVTK